jgi:hypothetical protein
MIAGLAAAGLVHAPTAAADTTDLGSQADVDVVDIEIEQHWTVSNLQPSTDAIPYRPVGALWEATVDAELPHGGIPMITGFVARTDSVSYPVLWGVAAPMGVPPAALPPGGTTSGKLYFDVTGPPPDSVAYTADGADLAVWTTGG